MRPWFISRKEEWSVFYFLAGARLPTDNSEVQLRRGRVQ
jgi:hypothetical protein